MLSQYEKMYDSLIRKNEWYRSFREQVSLWRHQWRIVQIYEAQIWRENSKAMWWNSSRHFSVPSESTPIWTVEIAGFCHFSIHLLSQSLTLGSWFLLLNDHWTLGPAPFGWRHSGTGWESGCWTTKAHRRFCLYHHALFQALPILWPTRPWHYGNMWKRKTYLVTTIFSKEDIVASIQAVSHKFMRLLSFRLPGYCLIVSTLENPNH